MVRLPVLALPRKLLRLVAFCVVAEPLQSSSLVGAELGQILASNEIAVGLQIAHRASEIDAWSFRTGDAPWPGPGRL